MSKDLIIAEKPSVAKDIARALGGFADHKEYLESEERVITWAVGHLVEFISPEEIDPKYKAWQLEDLPILPKEFVLKAKEKCGARLKVIGKLMKRKDVDSLVNACDAGREGELIFRELVAFFKSKKPILRLWLQSMTPEAIRQGFAQLKAGAEYENLYQAARCRSEADWLIGINATRALTRRMKTRQEKVSWSAGRVQTPTLAMLSNKELEILQFRTTPFWRLKATFQAPAQEGLQTEPHTYEAVYYNPQVKQEEGPSKREEWILDQAEAQRIAHLVGDRLGWAQETRKPENISSPRLFDLTTLQREANRRFGMSAKNTLAAAQRLYESYKLITYPRTSSKVLPSDYVGQVRQIMGALRSYAQRPPQGPLDFALYAKASERLLAQEKWLNFGKIFDDKGVSDHFAIIPTTQRPPASLRDDEAKIYNLILRRFLAAFYPPAVKVKIERLTEIPVEGETFHFRTRSSYFSDEGWMAVYGREAKENAPSLPALNPQDGQPLAVLNQSVEIKEDTTQPPTRINEARLLSLMENAGKQVEDEDLSSALKDMGLGTPATRAEIIEALLTRGYIERADRALRATTKGIILIDLLKRIACNRLASPELTGQMEYNLNQVEHGSYQRAQYMDDIVDYTQEIVAKTKTFQYEEIYAKERPLGLCPVCKKRQVYERLRFYACEGNHGAAKDECSFIIWKDKNGRYLDLRTMSELLERGETDFLEGFKGTGNQTYRAKLSLRQGNLELEPEHGVNLPATVELPVSGEILGACPFDPQCQVVETPTAYTCQKKCVEHGHHKYGLNIARVICQRPLTPAELKTLLEAGRTELLDNFTSRYNKPFKGYLILNPLSGKYRFEFEKRTKKEAAPAAAPASPEEPPAPEKAAPEAPSEEAPAPKKRTRKAASSKKAAAETEAAPIEKSAAPAKRRSIKKKDSAPQQAAPQAAEAETEGTPKAAPAKSPAKRKKASSEAPF